MIDGQYAFPPNEIRKQLQRILRSSRFDVSERNREFLTYVVEEALEDRIQRIKAYNIATCVFGRDPSFDPQTDPIVRIEARRLRRALETYYLTEGKHDSLRITIPKGAYAPVFENAEHLQPLAESSDLSSQPQAGWQGPVIFVSRFDEEGDPSVFPNFARGFTRHVIVALTRFSDLFVFGPDTTFQYAQAPNSEMFRNSPDVDFILTGGTAVSGDHFGVEALLIDARTGRNLWGESFERKLQPREIIMVRDEVANYVARTLAQPYGVIFSNQAKASEGKPPNALSSYDCIIRFHQYWRSYNHQLHEEGRVCLEKTIRNDPDFAEAYACLSQVYTNTYRFGFDKDPNATDPRPIALTLAHRAIELAPNSSRGHHALALAYWFCNDIRASFHALETGLALNPNDTEIMADAGLRYALLAEWDKAVPLIQGSYKRNPAQPDTYRIALFLYHYSQGRYGEALAEAIKVEAPNVVYGFLAVAVCSAQLGRQREANAAVEKLLAVDPNYGDHIVADLQKRNVHPDLIHAIVAGLKKAGLAGSDTGLTKKMAQVARSA